MRANNYLFAAVAAAVVVVVVVAVEAIVYSIDSY